jgi:hypothetical protein
VFKVIFHTAQETHCVAVIKTSHLIRYREITGLCSDNHAKHINTICWQNVEFLIVKTGVILSNHWTLTG